MKYEDANKITSWSTDMQGVFTMPDLKVLFGERTEAALYKKLTRFIDEGILIKIMRGIYATPQASLNAISCRINPDAYISTGIILAQNMVIGSVPARKVQAMKVGRSRTYTFETGAIEHLSINPQLFFGFEIREGIKYATPEKAFLDACYLFSKGITFSFDLDTDVNRGALDPTLISRYLSKYNKQFVTFLKERWNYD